MKYYNRENDLILESKGSDSTFVYMIYKSNDNKEIKINYGLETFRFLIESEVLVELKN